MRRAPSPRPRSGLRSTPTSEHTVGEAIAGHHVLSMRLIALDLEGGTPVDEGVNSSATP